MRSAVLALALTDFRSYAKAELATSGRSVYLFGPNGAGKTNLVEAISLLSPGRGMRGAALSELGRREPGEPRGRDWTIGAELAAETSPVRIGTGVEKGAPRRLVRIDGAPAGPGALLEYLRPLWLTPAQDRIFLEGAGERRRFLDRLTFAAEPIHAVHVAAYERALRERTRLLAGDASADPGWVAALEARMAEAGGRIAEARAATLAALQAEIDDRGERPFPQAGLRLEGEAEAMALEGASPPQIEARLRARFADGRPRDAAAGRALGGPHRADLRVVHRPLGRPAAECSTGEQKALILNLVLAQGARLSRAKSQPNPILLLDEVAAHLDRVRRAALIDEVEALGLQAFLTGTDEQLFEAFKGRALGVRVDASRLLPMD